jgi:alkanesulfonate monooxygenase SsuD/methylene tetrahydromethanopterin reductase-like flavin-dependent oxidoreductase (luciferase family)
MNYGFVQPGADARTAVDLAVAAEEAGWDGYFVWEPVWGWDAWALLAAAAVRTQRIRLGTMLTPPSRMRPWKLASETLTVDHLSGGRVTLAVGLGATDTGFDAFGEVTDRRTRAELLDESLDIISELWQGRPLDYDGKHYKVRKTTFAVPPPTVQQPRIPVWVVAAWPHEKSMRRALRFDGMLPSVRGGDGAMRQATPDELREIRAWADERRDGAPFDIVVEGVTPADDRERALATVRPWIDAGATWWIEAMWDAQAGFFGVERIRQRLAAGPPRGD